MGLSYATYLRLDELLALQEPISDGPEHDEHLFIVIHQVYELWLKQILHETKLLQLALENGHTPIAARTLKRILAILKTLVAQIEVLETMSPVSFASFRERLGTAGGFRSVQFRQLEAILGNRRQSAVDALPDSSQERARLERIFGRHSVYDSFLRFLALLGYPIPRDVLGRDLSQPHQESPAIQESLIEIYRHDPGASQICELMVDLDAGLQEWRYRHAAMVRRTIGSMPGTAGSDEAIDVRSTMSRPLFPDLWAIRSEL